MGTDLVYGSLTKLVVAFQHDRLGHVNGRWVVFLATGSIPASLAGVLVIDQVRRVHGSADAFLLHPLGVVLVVSALAIITGELLPWLRHLGLRPRSMNSYPVVTGDGPREVAVSPPPTPPGLRLFYFLIPETWINGWLKAVLIILLGSVVGFVVGLTSVGSGSLFALALLLFSRLRPREVVGTDVAHAAILVTVAGLAHATIGTVDFRLAANLLMGSLPGVILGSRTASILRQRPLKLGMALLILLAGWQLL